MIAVLFGLACLAGATTVIIARAEFPHGTADLDEVAYVSQANAIANHELTLPAATHDPYFRPFLSGVRDDRVVFKYQPEWPALIAASNAVFGSTLPLRALMAMTGVFSVAWFAWELTRDRRVVVVAAALVVASPFAWIQTASLLGYQLSFVLGTAAAAALVRSARARSRARWTGLAAGVLLGLAILHRPFDALLATAPVLAYWGWSVWRRREIVRDVAPVALGGLPFAALFFAYNQSVMGSFTRLAYNVTGPLDAFGFGWRASFGRPGAEHTAQIHYTVGRAFSTVSHLFVALPRFVALAPAVIVLVGVCLWTRRRVAQTWLLVAMIAVVVVGYFFWWGVANSYAFALDRSLGPFYYYPLLAPLSVLAATGAVSVLRSRVIVVGLIVVGLGWSGFASASVLRDARDAGKDRTADVRASQAPAPSLVIEASQFPADPYLRVATDATLGEPHLVAVDIPGRRLELVDRFPDRTTYLNRSFRNLDDPFGKELHDQVELRAIRGRAIVVRFRVSMRAGERGTPYVRIGNAAPRLLTDTSVRLDPTGLPSNGATTIVAFGVTVSPSGAAAPTTLTKEWLECGTEARVGAGGDIEVLDPCDGRHHYEFPNGANATTNEDVSSELLVRFTPL
jgi:hypothetical protein